MANNMEITLTPYQTIFYYEWLQDPERSDYNIVIDNTIVGEIDKKSITIVLNNCSTSILLPVITLKTDLMEPFGYRESPFSI